MTRQPPRKATDTATLLPRRALNFFGTALGKLPIRVRTSIWLWLSAVALSAAFRGSFRVIRVPLSQPWREEATTAMARSNHPCQVDDMTAPSPTLRAYDVAARSTDI